LLFVLVIKTFSRFMKIENITKNLPIFMSFWRHDKIYNKKCTASINLIVDRYYPVDLFRKELETIRMKWESNGINWWFSIIFQINKNNKKILNLINEIYAPRDVLQQLNK
jgi:hypothetical protein